MRGRAVMLFLPLLGMALPAPSFPARAALPTAHIHIRITVHRPLLASPSEITRPSRADAVVWVFILHLRPATQRLTLQAQCLRDEDPAPFFVPGPTPGQAVILLQAEVPAAPGCANLEAQRRDLETFLQTYQPLLHPHVNLLHLKATFRELLGVAFQRLRKPVVYRWTLTAWTYPELYRHLAMARGPVDLPN